MYKGKPGTAVKVQGYKKVKVLYWRAEQSEEKGQNKACGAGRDQESKSTDYT